jgi:excisionase family DNA binding protein
MNLLSAKEAAEKLGVDSSRIRQFILEGRLPAQKIGNSYAINEADLALVADRKPGRPSTKQTTGKTAAKKRGGGTGGKGRG